MNEFRLAGVPAHNPGLSCTKLFYVFWLVWRLDPPRRMAVRPATHATCDHLWQLHRLLSMASMPCSFPNYPFLISADAQMIKPEFLITLS